MTHTANEATAQTASQPASQSSSSVIPVMEGITAKTVATKRITTRVLFSGEDNGVAVLFLHGNLTSATWWEETMLTLPKGFRGIAPDQRGFGAADTAKKIDATRGLSDLSDDAIALLDHLGIKKAHVVGKSMGGSVIWRLMMDYPDRILSVTLAAPGSPFGFGGTKDAQGTPCFPDFAGSGAGLNNPALLKALRENDRSAQNPFSPRSALRLVIVKPPFIPAREEELISAMVAVHQGPQDIPGDPAPSPNWTSFAPGKFGIANAISGKYAGDVSRLWKLAPKPPVLWIRGANDVVVSNAAASDAGTLGQRGFLPNYPGKDVYPPQPMIDQTRYVLEQYTKNGGSFKEITFENCGHSPHLEKAADFNKALHEHLRTTK